MSAGFLEWFSEEARRLYGEVRLGTQMDKQIDTQTERQKDKSLTDKEKKRQKFD
jgi:hypothetical protein